MCLVGWLSTFRMYSTMSGRQVYSPVVRTSAHFEKYSPQGIITAHCHRSQFSLLSVFPISYLIITVKKITTKFLPPV